MNVEREVEHMPMNANMARQASTNLMTIHDEMGKLTFDL